MNMPDIYEIEKDYCNLKNRFYIGEEEDIKAYIDAVCNIKNYSITKLQPIKITKKMAKKAKEIIAKKENVIKEAKTLKGE